MASTSRPCDAATARSRIDRASFSVIVPRADRELPEAGGSRSVCHLGHLAGLSFAAVDDAPWSPRFRAADEVARVPEAGGDSLIRRVPEHPHALPAADFPGDLGLELEVVAKLIDAPAPVGLHVDPVGGVVEQVVERA